MTRPRISVPVSSVRKVCQLTGQTDRQVNSDQPAFNPETESRFGLFGTDLGSSFEHNGRLWFLFGDTWPVSHPVSDSDSIAWTTATQPEPHLQLEFINAGGKYQSPRLTGTDGSPLSTAGFEVPVAGFSADGQMYIFYSTDHVVELGVDGGLDVYWIGPDGSIGTTWANPAVGSGTWRPALAIGPSQPGESNSPITAITRFAGAVDVFWIGPDGAVATTWANPAIDGGNWHPAFPITPPGAARADSPIAAVTRLEGALDVFWIGPDGAVGATWANPAIDGGSWHPAFPITPPGASGANSPIAAVTRLEGALDVFWIGPDGAVATTWANPAIDGGNWHPAFPITPPGASGANSPIAAVTRLEGALDVFWIGPDGAVGATWANPAIDGGSWHPAFPITPPGASGANSPIAAVTRLEGALDVFWIGPDGAVATTWANPAIDGGPWHPPFPITAPGAASLNAAIAAITRRNGQPRKDLMGRTVLAAARNNDPMDLQALYDFSVLREAGKFLNVACVIAPAGVTGLPFDGPTLLVWGSGRYRESNVYLACARLGDVQHVDCDWRFFAGQEAGSLNPLWSSDKGSAAALFIHPQVGELSVAWVEPFGLWLMLYNAASPRGINARVAISPWGPWSDPVLIFDPWWQGVGYGHFMHVAAGNDPMSDPGREDQWGGEYGPYLINRYTQTINDPGPLQVRVYFVLSTWNPYNTILMAATIQREPDTD